MANTIYKQTSQSCSKDTTNTPDRTSLTNQSTNIVSSAQFFVFTGVITFLYSLVFLIIYVFFKHKYDNNIYIPLIVSLLLLFYVSFNDINNIQDFGSTCLLALFWFAGSIAWAKAISDIQNYTNPDNLRSSLSICNPKSVVQCKSIMSPSYGSIVISCVSRLKI